MGDRAFGTLMWAILLLIGCVVSQWDGNARGRAQATCYAAGLPYVETTSAGVVCGEPPVLLPILTEPTP